MIAKLVSILVLGVGAVGLAEAQASLTPPTTTAQAKVAKPAHGMRAINAILAKLNLSKDQHKQVKALEKARKDDARAYKESNPGADIVDKSGLKAHNQKSLETFMTGLKGVLTPAQWDQFQTQYKASHGRKKALKVTPPLTPAKQ